MTTRRSAARRTTPRGVHTPLAAPRAGRAPSNARGGRARSGPSALATAATRCWWADSDPRYRVYHDREWGRPVVNDRRLFEKLALEGFQAGLSWLTILRKRPRFRAAFADFDPARVARFHAQDVRRLLRDPGIVRHRGKIEAAIANAQRVLAVRAEFGSFAAYIWSFEPDPAPAPASRTAVPSATAASRALAADLKARGFRFVGPTIVYAFMQAMGLVNDHLAGCAHRPAIERARAELRRPRRRAAAPHPSRSAPERR
jgi:DNA-3-methyladenine glycosylase I